MVVLLTRTQSTKWNFVLRWRGRCPEASRCLGHQVVLKELIILETDPFRGVYLASHLFSGTPLLTPRMGSIL